MNIFIKELRSNFMTFLFFSLGIIALLCSSYVKFDPNNQEVVKAMYEVLKNMPIALQVISGFNPKLDLSNFLDIYILIYQYQILVICIYASLLGGNILAKELNAHTAEFLYSKPVSRYKIIFYKYFSGLFYLVIISLVTFITIAILNYFISNQTIYLKELFIINVLQIVTAMIFYTVSFGLNGINNYKSVSTYGITILFITYIISLIAKMLDTNYLNYLTPFKYFDPLYIFKYNQVYYYNIVLSILIIVSMLMFLLNKYVKKDL